MKRRKGFTLSEILTALTIIGVIAAITVPVLNRSAQEKELNTGLKKAYSTLKQGESAYYADRGERLIYSDWKAVHTFKPVFIKYFNVLLDCGMMSGSHNAKCLSSSDFAGKYKTYNGNAISSGYFDDGEFILNDGMYAAINNGGAYNFISVDVNGWQKKPNRLGKDLFMFQLTDDNGIVPMGAEGTAYYSADDAYCSNTSTSNMNGAGCTYKALQK